MTCAMLLPVSDQPSDPRFTAHRMPMAMAHEALSDMIDSGAALLEAITTDQPQEERLRLRQIGLAQAETYFDLMAEAATHARAIKP